jgi:peptidoglycan/xylan/chitin deacetylase (PgdA/CDA1 family)
MNRRELTQLFATGLVAATLAPRAAFAARSPRVSITMDDFNVRDLDATVAAKRNDAILAALRAHSVKAAIFVCGWYIDSPEKLALVKRWSDEGHLVANHTFSHRNYANADFDEYAADILRCEALIKDLPRFRRLFRFPYLKEGKTAEHRDRLRAFLAEHGYKNGAVTIDASDWYIDDRLRKRLAADPSANTAGHRDYYLQHIADRSRFYDEVSRKALGRSVSHTLLVHHNLINERFLGDVLAQYRELGWKLIDAEEAYRDPVFDRQPDVLPAGDSLVLALAVEKGMVRPRWPSEDGVYEAPAMDRLGL